MLLRISYHVSAAIQIFHRHLVRWLLLLTCQLLLRSQNDVLSSSKGIAGRKTSLMGHSAPQLILLIKEKPCQAGRIAPCL